MSEQQQWRDRPQWPQENPRGQQPPAKGQYPPPAGPGPYQAPPPPGQHQPPPGPGAYQPPPGPGAYQPPPGPGAYQPPGQYQQYQPHPQYGAMPHQYLPAVRQQGMPMVIAPRSVALAVIASFFIPGLGSMIAGKTGKGVAILLSSIVAAISCIVLIGFILWPIVWILGMIFAATDTRDWNRARGIIS